MCQNHEMVLDTNRTGVLCGSMTGGITPLAQQYKKFHTKSLSKVSPLTIPQTIHNSASSVLAIEHKIKGISSGYHCMETSGLEALCDALELLNTEDYENMIIGAGEDLINESQAMQQIGCVLLLTKKITQKKEFGFEINCLINRGKSWLLASENLADVLNTYFDKSNRVAKTENEKWLYFNFQDHQVDKFKSYPVDIIEYPEYNSYFSVAPFLGVSNCMQLYSDFKLLVFSSEGHAILLSFKKVNI